MSPVGGVGINLAVADAVAAGRMLADPLQAGRVTTRELARVQARRWVPTALIQGVQRGIHTGVIARAVGGGADNRALGGGADNPETAPAGVRMVARMPLLRSIAGYGVAIGPLPEHVPAFARR
jgi:2-polyprenyl-6-methoxyphenol hydroxylase-like FAD-dependent oxidoreductase